MKAIWRFIGNWWLDLAVVGWLAYNDHVVAAVVVAYAALWAHSLQRQINFLRALTRITVWEVGMKVNALLKPVPQEELWDLFREFEKRNPEGWESIKADGKLLGIDLMSVDESIGRAVRSMFVDP